MSTTDERAVHVKALTAAGWTLQTVGPYEDFWTHPRLTGGFPLEAALYAQQKLEQLAGASL
jgi:hypothetical protein